MQDNYRKEMVVDGSSVTLDILDTSGQDDFSAVRDQFMTDADGFLCVYSISFGATFLEVGYLFERAQRIVGSNDFSFLIVGNKCDLVKEREVEKFEGKALAEGLGCSFLESSAKESINVDEAFIHLVRKIMSRKKNQGGEEKKKEEKKKKKKRRCTVV